MSKRLFSLLCLILCVALLNTAVVTASATGDSEEKDAGIDEIFSDRFLNQVRVSDGAAAYEIETEILNAYQRNQVAFLEHMNVLNDTDKDFFSRFLVSSMYYDGDWTAFKSYLNGMSSHNGVASILLNTAMDYETQAMEWETAYEKFLSQPEPEGLFSADILKEAIASHSGSYLYDQEFCGYLREMYELDPNLFVQTMGELEKNQVKEIAAQIAYAEYLNLGDVEGVKSMARGTVTSESALDSKSVSLKNAFVATLQKAALDIVKEPLFQDEMTFVTNKPVNGVMATTSVTIGAISYANVKAKPTQLEIYNPTDCKTKISGLTPNKQYRVELWARHDESTNNNLKSSVTYTANSSGVINAALRTTFDYPGNIWTMIKVYSGSTLVASRTGASMDMVYARWKIELPLASNNYGTLKLYYASGVQAYSCTAFGQSVDNTHWSVHLGNTPPGDYYGWDFDPSNQRSDYPVVSYGPYDIIKMEGNHDPGYSNDYVDGGSVTNKPRSGIYIHGGRSQTTYTPTHGCVRVHDADMLNLTNQMQAWLSSNYHSRGRVSITR